MILISYKRNHSYIWCCKAKLWDKTHLLTDESEFIHINMLDERELDGWSIGEESWFWVLLSTTPSSPSIILKKFPVEMKGYTNTKK